LRHYGSILAFVHATPELRFSGPKDHVRLLPDAHRELRQAAQAAGVMLHIKGNLSGRPARDTAGTCPRMLCADARAGEGPMRQLSQAAGVTLDTSCRYSTRAHAACHLCFACMRCITPQKYNLSLSLGTHPTGHHD
jgi:hypothetical protein